MSVPLATIRPHPARALPLVGAAAMVFVAGALPAQRQELRSPQESVFAAFPAADGYQAIVRNIDAAARRRIEGRLPFRVHFNDLGEHAVYVALRGRLPLGMVYLRSEEDAFGLTEIEWAITLDMRVAGFRFQHTRNAQSQAVESSEFARLLAGCSAGDLPGLLDPDGRLTPAARGVPPGTEELAAMLARSALKALSVVDVVWATEVQKLYDLAVGLQAFPAAQRFVRIWPPARETPGLPAEHDDDRVVLAVRAFGKEPRPLGVVARATAHAATGAIVTWVVDDAGVVVAADTQADAPAPVRAACQEAVGKTLASAGGLDGPVGASARALTMLLQPTARPGR